MCYFTLFMLNLLRRNRKVFTIYVGPSDRLYLACYRGVRHGGGMGGAKMVKAETPMQPLSNPNKSKKLSIASKKKYLENISLKISLIKEIKSTFRL